MGTDHRLLTLTLVIIIIIPAAISIAPYLTDEVERSALDKIKRNL